MNEIKEMIKNISPPDDPDFPGKAHILPGDQEEVVNISNLKKLLSE